MRKLLAGGLVVAVLVAVLAVGDVLVRRAVERDVARRIEASVPGTTATVHISSFPFVGRLLATGSVPSLRADVSGVKAGPFPVDRVAISVSGVNLSRSDLFRGKGVLRSIRSATISAVISQQSLDTGSGLPITLGAGTVGVGGVQVQARISVQSAELSITIPPLPSLTVPLLPAALLPCGADAVIAPGELTLSCTTSTIPPALLAAVNAGG